MRDGGTYALVTVLDSGLDMRVGSLGVYSFLPGYYVYVGSALGGLSSRLMRHIRLKKKLFWHIDYLLQEARLAQIWYALGQNKLECTWNSIASNLPGATSSVPGFGASDCQCPSHLTYFSTVPSFNLFQQNLQQGKLPEAHLFDLGEIS